jgi:hypothetical protein
MPVKKIEGTCRYGCCDIFVCAPSGQTTEVRIEVQRDPECGVNDPPENRVAFSCEEYGLHSRCNLTKVACEQVPSV